jgi:hypothetical protein
MLMELAMSKAYFATVVAILVTASLATNLLVVGMRGSAIPGLGARLHARRLGRRLKHAVDAWVAGMLARRERQATIYALYHMTDRELGDVGPHRTGASISRAPERRLR